MKRSKRRTGFLLVCVAPAVILFFIGNEGLSILENLGLMGVPYPAFLREALDVLKEQNDRGKSDDEM